MADQSKFEIGTKINVVGTTGMGKTTLASTIAEILNIEHVEMDSLFWGENWTQPTQKEFLPIVNEALRGETWVIDGNYSFTRHIIWEKVDSVIFLDYPKFIAIWRVTIRSIRRIITKEKIWGKNYESFKGAFFGKNSLIKWLLTTYNRRRRQYYDFIESDEFVYINFVIFKNPRQTNKWLRGLTDHSKNRDWRQNEDI